jgi:hypothetical protein
VNDLTPRGHSHFSQVTMVGGGDCVAGQVKQIGDGVVDGDETLKLAR